MKIPASVLALALAASIPLAASAQQPPAPDGQAQGQRGQMMQAREAAKTAAFNDLSADHRARVQAIVDGINNGTTTDVRGAVSQIDAILSPDESKAVLAERDKLTETMRANAPADAPSPRPRPNGPASADAGRFLMTLGVSRERMRALRDAMHGNAAAGAPGTPGAPKPN